MVFPSEIVGKRIRVKLDGKQLIKVHLDKLQQTNIEHKVSWEIHKVGLSSLSAFFNSHWKPFLSRNCIFYPRNDTKVGFTLSVSLLTLHKLKKTAWYLQFSVLFPQIDTFASVYKKLTGREVTFEFPEPYLWRGDTFLLFSFCSF